MTSGSDSVNDMTGWFSQVLVRWGFVEPWEIRDLRAHLDAVMSMYERSLEEEKKKRGGGKDLPVDSIFFPKKEE